MEITVLPYKLKFGDKVAIVSLSSGTLGEQFVEHEIKIGLERLKSFGLNPIIMPNSMRGVQYLKEHPEARAEDLKNAFIDKNIKMVMTAIGGDDTYKIIPYLMEDNEFIMAVRNNHKIFTGFSDTTINHFMFNRIGLFTFYGPAFLPDICELDSNMLPYTRKYFLLYFENLKNIKLESSPVWYLDRIDYSINSIGTKRVLKKEIHGFELLNGTGVRSGKLFGGCIESIYDLLTGERYAEEKEVNNRYNLIPPLNELQEKILFLETSEEKTSPQKLYTILMELKNRKILSSVQGIMIGKPYNEVYYDEYKMIYKNIFSDLDTPILYNINFGHAYPRCFIPYDSLVIIDFDNKKVKISSEIFAREKILCKNRK